ncbi:hypothetical protein [Actinomyces sp.]|uniref:hypothetical protein n=1 Tax=Actinomyces sp. TaxID=29317 RepID=UPI0026DC21BA|nr:hypothetical protein [Actinomyces sp.]MDO4901737.1 hypothetical protein [Actinomyces sp.]
MTTPSFPVDTGGGVCTAQIDTTIPGSVESVDRAADWLKKLQDGFSDASTMFSGASSTSRYTLSGEIADAAADYADDLHDACKDAYNRAKKAVDVIRSFADQLGWRKDDMAEHRETAIAGGLTVVGNVIAAPIPVSKPADLGNNATAAQKQEWTTANSAYEDYQTKKALFDEVSEDVQKTFDKLDDWIDEHLVTAESNILANVLMDGVKEMVENAFGEGAEATAQNVYYHKATALYNTALAAATAKAIKRSGNPAVRSGSKAPNQDTVDRNLGRSPKADAAEHVAKTGKKAAKAAGISVTLGFIGIELATGDSPSEVLLPAAASAATAVAIAGAPVWATVFATGSVAVGVGYLYQNYVPLEIRGKIDEGLNDMWDWGADRVDDATDWASNQWNRIFG